MNPGLQTAPFVLVYGSVTWTNAHILTRFLFNHLYLGRMLGVCFFYWLIPQLFWKLKMAVFCGWECRWQKLQNWYDRNSCSDPCSHQLLKGFDLWLIICSKHTAHLFSYLFLEHLFVIVLQGPTFWQEGHVNVFQLNFASLVLSIWVFCLHKMKST